MLCMSGHARRVPEASVHPAVRLLQPALSRKHQTAIVEKVNCHACCQCIQLEQSSLSLSFTLTLQSGSRLSSPSRSFSQLHVSEPWTIIVKYLFECADLKFMVSGRSIDR